MEKILILAFIALAAASDMDPKCFVRPPYVNPRTCCLDPTIVKDELHEKCMKEVYKPPRRHHIDAEIDHTEINLVVRKDELKSMNEKRKKRSIDELPSELDSISEEEDDDDESNSSGHTMDSSSEESSEERRPHWKHHGRHPYPRHYRHGRHHHGRRHHGKHYPGKYHHGRHHHSHHHRHPHHKQIDQRLAFDFDDTYVPVFHRDFAKWSVGSVRFQKLSIYWRCVFNETGIIDEEHNVIMPNVKSYLSDVLEETNPFLPIMEDAFNSCYLKRKEFLEKLKEAKDHYILDSTPMERKIFREQHPHIKMNTDKMNEINHAYFLARCVKRIAFRNCPDEKFRTDDKLCIKSRSYLKNCPYSGRQYYQNN